MIIVTVWFHEVDNVEAVYFVLLSILHSEVVPLSEAIGTIIILEIEIIFRIRNFNRFSKIG